MKYGFVRVAAISPRVKVADVAANTAEIIEALKGLSARKAEVAVFPELCLCGYTCGDLFFDDTLIKAAKDALISLAERSKDVAPNMLFFVGLPMEKDCKLYNCAAAVCNGEVLAIVPKTALPNYGEFYEKRYFTGASEECSSVVIGGKEVPFGKKILVKDEKSGTCVGCEISEDAWVCNPPSQAIAAAGAQIVVNLSAADEVVGKAEYRRSLIASLSGREICAYVYSDANEGESVTDCIFAGHCMIAENGGLIKESELFAAEPTIAEVDVEFLNRERRRISTFEVKKDGFVEVAARFIGESDLEERRIERLPFVPCGKDANERLELILSLQAHALARRSVHVGAKSLVIGVSGGLDSALAFLAAARAVDLCGMQRSDILAVSMPGFGTSDKTFKNSLLLPRALGASVKEIPIADLVERHFKDIGHDAAVKNVTYENAQARARTYNLMDLANEYGGIVVGTGDLSELALGWCTYNGDHMSMYAVNGGVPKTLVKHLTRYEADRIGGACKDVLYEILDTEISPELLPPDETGAIAQKTEDLVGPYELHDFFLYHALRRGDSPKRTFYLAAYAFDGKFDERTIAKWLKNFYRRFFSQQFKRSCMPDGVKVGSVTLSPRSDFRMPSDAAAKLWIDEAEKIEKELRR